MYLNSTSVECFSEAMGVSYNTGVLILAYLRDMESEGYELQSLTKAFMERAMGLKLKVDKEKLLDLYEEFQTSHVRKLARDRKRRERKRHADVTQDVTQDVTLKSREESRSNVTEKEESGSPLNGPSPPVTPVTPIIPTPREEKARTKGSKSAFSKPTVDEVRAYCLERRNNVDPQSFVDFYDSKGWLVGRTPMRDWKASVRTWERRHNTPGMTTNQPSTRFEPQPNFVDE